MERPNPHAHQKTHDFLKEVVAEKTNKKLLDKSLGQFNTAKNLNILATYYGSAATIDNIANIYNISRQRVHQILGKTLKLLWQNTEFKTRVEYPQKEIIQRKPLLPYVLRSQLKPHAYQIVKEAAAGTKSARRIQRLTGLPAKEVRVAMSRIKKENYHIPPRTQATQDRKRIAGILSSDDIYEIKKTMQNLNPKRVPSLLKFGDIISISNIISPIGISKAKIEKVWAILKRARIPIVKTTQVYRGVDRSFYVIPSKFLNEAQQVIQKDLAFPKLSKSIVEQLNGPKSQNSPTTTHFSRKKVEFESPSNILRRIGIGRVPKGITSAYFFTGTTIPLFKYQTRYLLPKENVRDFEKHVRKNFRDLLK